MSESSNLMTVGHVVTVTISILPSKTSTAAEVAVIGGVRSALSLEMLLCRNHIRELKPSTVRGMTLMSH